MSDKPIRDDDFDLYVLGAPDGDELAAFEARIASDKDAARKTAEARGRMAMLALAAPRVEPSPGAKEGLMRQLASTAKGRQYPRAAQETETGRFGLGWWSVVWAPVAAGLALATIFLWLANTRLTNQIEQQHAQIQKMSEESNRTAEMVELESASDTIVVPLAASRDVAGARGHVLYNPRLGKVLYTDSLGPAPAGKSYQLWLVPVSGTPISEGLLTPEAGQGSRIFASIAPGTFAAAFAVTLEPSGGRPQPTGPKVLIGAVPHIS